MIGIVACRYRQRGELIINDGKFLDLIVIDPLYSPDTSYPSGGFETTLVALYSRRRRLAWNAAAMTRTPARRVTMLATCSADSAPVVKESMIAVC